MCFSLFSPEITEKWKKVAKPVVTQSHSCTVFPSLSSEPALLILTQFANMFAVGREKIFRRTFCRLHNLIKHKVNCGPFPWKLIQTSGWTKETEKFTQTDCYLVASKKLTKRYATSWHCEGTFEQTSLILTKRRLFLLCTQLFFFRGRFLVEYTFQSLFTHNDD